MGGWRGGGENGGGGGGLGTHWKPLNTSTSKTLERRPSEDNGRGAVGAVREGGDDVEWVGKALTAVETERVWNGERGSVGEALKTVWVVGWRCRQLFEACYFFLTGRQAKTDPSGFHWRRPSRGRRICVLNLLNLLLLKT